MDSQHDGYKQPRIECANASIIEMNIVTIALDKVQTLDMWRVVNVAVVVVAV